MENSQVTIKTRDSLATRFILIAATLVIILQLVFAIFQIYGNYQRNLDGLVNDANNTALLLSTVTTEAMLTSDFLFLETLMQQTNNAPDVIYSFISDTTGNPTTRFVDRSEPIILDIIDSGEASTLLAIFDMAAQEPNVHIVTLPIELEGEAIGEVHLAYSLASIQSELVRSIVSTSLASILMVLGLTLGIFLVFEQTVRRPLQYLGELAQDLASGNLKRRAEIQRQNEIGQLGNSFNNMAAQLEALIDGLEQRVAARTRDLEIAADVSSQVSRVLDMKELLPYLVNTTREGFKLAHVSIFLHQSETGILNLAASSGNIGQMMMEEGKQFHLNDKGLVPLTARRKSVV